MGKNHASQYANFGSLQITITYLLNLIKFILLFKRNKQNKLHNKVNNTIHAYENTELFRNVDKNVNRMKNINIIRSLNINAFNLNSYNRFVIKI